MARHTASSRRLSNAIHSIPYQLILNLSVSVVLRSHSFLAIGFGITSSRYGHAVCLVRRPVASVVLSLSIFWSALFFLFAARLPGIDARCTFEREFIYPRRSLATNKDIGPIVTVNVNLTGNQSIRNAPFRSFSRETKKMPINLTTKQLYQMN